MPGVDSRDVNIDQFDHQLKLSADERQRSMARRNTSATQQDGAPVRDSYSPGRRAYNQRLLKTRSHIVVTNNNMSIAEASRLALKSVGPYKPSAQAVPGQQAAAAATPTPSAETAHQAPARSRPIDIAPMKDRTKTQDATPMPSAAVLKEVAAGPLFAKLTGSAAMSAYRHSASQTNEQAAQGSAGTQPPQQPSKANALQPQLRQQGMHPEQAEAEQTAVCDPAKEDADNWSAQLRAACHTITHDQVNNLDAAKEEMARALMYIKSTEQIFRGLKRQHESCTGSPALEWYLLREQKYIQSDIESECARVATLACLIKSLERRQRPEAK